jgi:hypothetical protein
MEVGIRSEVAQLDAFVEKLKHLSVEQNVFIEALKAAGGNHLEYFNLCAAIITKFKKHPAEILDILMEIGQSLFATNLMVTLGKSVYFACYGLLSGLSSNSYMLGETFVYQMLSKLFAAEDGFAALAKACKLGRASIAITPSTAKENLDEFVSLVKQFCFKTEAAKLRIASLLQRVAEGVVSAARLNLRALQDKLNRVMQQQPDYNAFITLCEKQISQYGNTAYPLPNILACANNLIAANIPAELIASLFNKFLSICSDSVTDAGQKYFLSITALVETLHDFSSLSEHMFSVINTLTATENPILIQDFIACLRFINKSNVRVSENILDLAHLCGSRLGDLFSPVVVVMQQERDPIDNNIFRLFKLFLRSLKYEKYQNSAMLNDNTIRVAIVMFSACKEDDCARVDKIFKFIKREMSFLELMQCNYPNFISTVSNKQGFIVSEFFADMVVAGYRKEFLLAIFKGVNGTSGDIDGADKYFEYNSALCCYACYMLLCRHEYNSKGDINLLFAAGIIDNLDSPTVDNFAILFACMQKLFALKAFNKKIFNFLALCGQKNYFSSELGRLLQDHDNDLLSDFVDFLIIIDKLNIMSQKAVADYIFIDKKNLKLNIRLFTLILARENNYLEAFFSQEIVQFLNLFLFASGDLCHFRMSMLQSLIALFDLGLLDSNNLQIIVKSLNKFKTADILNSCVGCLYHSAVSINKSEVSDAIKTELLQFLIFLLESGISRENILPYVNSFITFAAEKFLPDAIGKQDAECFNSFMRHLAKLRDFSLFNQMTYMFLVSFFRDREALEIAKFSEILEKNPNSESYMREFNIFCGFSSPVQLSSAQAPSFFSGGGGGAAAVTASQSSAFGM